MIAANTPGKQRGSHRRADEPTHSSQHLPQAVDFAAEIGERAVVDEHVRGCEVDETGEDAAHGGDEDDGPLERDRHGVGERNAGVND